MELPVLVPLLACLLSALSALTILLRDPAHPGNRVATALVGGSAWWCLCQVLWTLEPTAERALVAQHLSGLGWGLIGPLALHLILEVTRAPGRRIRRALPWLYAVAALFTLCQVATPWVHVAMEPTAWGWGAVPGPLYIYCLLFTLGCAIPACVLGLNSIRTAPSPAERQQARTVAVALAAPLVLAPLTGGVLPLLGIQVPRLGGPSFAVLGVAIAWSYQRYGFSALAPGSFSREILEMLPDGVASLGLDGRVRTANGQLARLLGLEPGELQGFAIERVLSVDLHGSLGTSGLREVEGHLMPRHGGRVPVSVSTSVLRDKKGLPIDIVLVVRDLREVVDLRNHLVTSGRLAAVGELAAGIAHEINNPIAYVRANLGQLRVGWQRLAAALSDPTRSALRELIEEGEELIGESIDGVDRTVDIIRDVKGFAHGGSGEREPVDLNEVLRAVLRVAKPQLRYRAKVVRSLAKVPPVLGARQELQQVFLNLVVNASQAIDERGTVTVATRARDGFVDVSVADDGCGIPESDLERIYDPFFTTKPVGEGTGLGLAISYQIVRNHDAEILVDSTPGRGTTFTVRFRAALLGSGF